MRNYKIVTFIFLFIAQQNACYSDELFNNLLSRKKLITLIVTETKSTQKSIVVTEKLLGKQVSVADPLYDISEKKVTEIDGWLVWHHKDEDINLLSDLASKNTALIKKYLSTNLSNKKNKIEFVGVADTAAAEAYSNLCGIPFDKTYDWKKARYIWSIQVAPKSIIETCLDFGLHLAAVGITLVEKNNLLYRVAK